MAIINGQSKRSNDSTTMLEFLEKIDDILIGTKAIKDAGSKYLVRNNDESNEDFNFRIKIAKFTNVYRDVVENLAAKPFEQEVSIVTGENEAIPDVFSKFIEDVDGKGNNLTIFSSNYFFNAINYAVDWLHVDFTKVAAVPRKELTVQDEKRLGLRPFWTLIKARDVLEVKSEIINGKETLTYFEVFEAGTPNHIRVMKSNGIFASFELWQQNKTKEYVLVEEGPITINIIPVVPLEIGKRRGNSRIYNCPMNDAADLQLVLYENESALEFVKKMAAFPMLSGNGVSPAKGPSGEIMPLQIGPSRVLYAPTGGDGSSGTWTFIEPAATSMTFLKSDIKDTEQQIRELGRQPLTSQSGNLTVITTAVAAGKAKSAVAAWALKLKDSLENALKITALWYKQPYEPSVFVYTDFDAYNDNTADLTALKDARASRDISQQTYLSELKRRKVLSAEFDYESELERLLKETSINDDIQTI